MNDAAEVLTLTASFIVHTSSFLVLYLPSPHTKNNQCCMPPPHPDTRYLVALLSNDNQVIAEIYARFAERIERMVLSNSGSSDDARDVFQEGLISINRQARRPNFVLTCPFEAYLWCVCRGKWLNELRRRRREEVTISHFEGYTDVHLAEDLAEALLREEDRDHLFRRCFEQLGASCRQLLQLAWTGLSMEQVSQRMGISYGYARKHKSECIGQLMNRVQQSSEFADLT